ncbi:polysaccharide deacetylase family protein [Actinoplanes sp. G11-F43]|uniref:polysaccharide deacetylase family protein n=1 Tax=Actinoplanes sp. G11-F43 TaxID=3424130 RepID=UPI003D335475
MNTDKPTPDASTPGETAPVDEAAEPTVALTAPGDGSPAESPADEPTVLLSPAAAEATVDLSAAEADAGNESTADVSADSASGVEESEPTVVLTATATGVAEETAEAAEETAALPVEKAEATVTPPVAADTGESGRTVALPVEKSEETVTLSVGEVAAAVAAAEAAEKTAQVTEALKVAAAAEDEATAVISGGDEATIALPKPRTSPEATVALPVSRVAAPAAEPATAPEPPAVPLTPTPSWASRAGEFVPASGGESTVALPPVPAQRSAPTVTPPPAEPTIALPLGPRTDPDGLGTAPAVPPQSRPLSRRRLLWAIPAIAGTALVGGTVAALAGRDTPAATKAPNLVVSEPPPPIPSPAPTTPRPTAPVMKVPVHTLADFRKVVPGDDFPTDAIALTIDDGPHPVWTPQILRLLEKYHVPALFCMIGNQVLGHEPTARDVVADGHHIANHTWSHPLNVAELSARKALKEIDRAQDKIYSTTGYAPTLFRAPGGAWSDGLSKSVSKSSVIPMDWTTDPRDWSRPGVAHITKRLMAAKPGQILLCHDGGGDRSQTVASLRKVIPALQAKGLKFVALV